MSRVYKAAVVGLGRVGALYSEEHAPRTHFGAYMRHPRFEPAAVVDPSAQSREAFARRWPVYFGPVYSSVQDMLQTLRPDAVSVCVSPEAMPGVVAELAAAVPGILFLEKPLAKDCQGADNLAKTLARSGVPAAVNYHRLWDPAHVRFFQRIKASGQPVAARAVYGKGLFNYASHLVALLLKHFGPSSGVIPLSVPAAPDGGDPSASFLLHLAAGFTAQFLGLDSVRYDVLELDIFTLEEVFSLTAGGCRRRILRPVDGLFYPGYAQLAEAPPEEPDSQVEGLTQALDNLAEFLDDPTTELACDLDLGLQVLDALLAVRNG